MRQITLITGASDGIGTELARIMAHDGHDLALVARRRDRLETLADEIAAQGRPRPLVLPCDLSRPTALDDLETALVTANAQVAWLVNNAGFGLNGAVAGLDRESQLEMIDLNIRALTDLSLRFLPQISAARGGLLQVASIAAFLPGPNMAVYYATKAYVLSFSEALAQEVKAKGVRVSVLCPGPTATGFQNRAGLDAALFEALRPMKARAVAQAGYAGLMAGQRVVVPGFMNRISRLLASLTPHALLLPLVQRLQASRKR
jgi:short-subunit dehydrogenase